MTLAPVRRDALPGEAGRKAAPCGHPVPCGCAAVASCCENTCWLPLCKNDYPGGLRLLRRKMRNEAIHDAAYLDVTIDDIARWFGLNKRTIWHILEASNGYPA